MHLKDILKRFVLPSLLLISQVAFSQGKVITGKVTDSKDGSPLGGVSVIGKGSTTGTQTAPDGTFHITVSSSVTSLLFSSVGYATQEVSIAGKTDVSVSLVLVNSSLSEVVVIGYGTSRKKDLTGSVATVSAKDFQTGVITTPEQLVAGKIAGVSIISNNGQPGSGSTIRIRGGSSLSASNDPLIVLDGVPLDNGSISGASNPLSFINPNDIESFSILKDASAAAIYGTRAANGVIIITTKKGKGGKVKVNFSSVNSISKLIKKVDVLSAADFRNVINANGTSAQKAMMGSASTDWQNEIYQSAFATNNNITISGGITNLPYRVSIGYDNQNGILKTDNLERTSLGIAVNPVLFDNHLKIDVNLKGSLENVRFGNQGAIGAATSFDPTQPVYSKSPRFGGYYEWLLASSPTGLDPVAGRNPVGLLYQRFDESTPSRFIGNVQFDYKFHFLPDLHANLNVGTDYADGRGHVFVPDSAASNYVAGADKGLKTQYKQIRNNKLLEFYLNYVKDLNSIKSRIDIMAGYSYYDYLTTNYNYPTLFADGSINTGVPFPNYPFDKPENTLISYFGRLNYTFRDRYLLTATMRRDGSSRFAPKYRWGYFPSVAFAWKLKEENFLKNSKLISDMKLRLGYGVTGQQDGIGNYDYLSYYSLSNSGASYQFGNTFYQGFRPGGFYANRRWEKTVTYNAGLDFGFLNNRITANLDVYYKKTTNLLNNVAQPAGSNFSAFIVANVGDMDNKGVEFNINATPIQHKVFRWDASFNITYNKNTITNLTTVPKDPNYVGLPVGQIAGGIGGQFAQIDAVGSPKNTFYLYKQVYDVVTGLPVEGVFVDLNGDGIINQNDLAKSKSSDPKVFMGFSTEATYKKWSAGFVLRSSLGNYVYNNNYSQTGTLAQLTGNSVLYNASTSYLQTHFTGNSLELLSDYYIQNASFLKMDNLNVGYNFGRIANNQATLRLSATIQNVFVITKYKGLDPELSSGIDNNLYPRPRIYALGINLDF
ncbi:MAG TPA: SusC/RagA family TonB-linked outer membrane protein [Chitinophagaceae bacterium]|nr:SusC/RagA family TonB-linked outer membrane protein [Chitinophagaceae bacterium]